MTSRLSLSVVIPSYRRLDRLPRLLREYRAQGADEIVVVLDGPHPQWERVLTDPGDDLIVLELDRNHGLALARIAGLEASNGDVVLAVDDDVLPAAGLVDAHRSHHAAETDRVLVGYMPVALPSRRGRDDAPSYLYARDYEKQVDVWRRTDSETLLRSLWGGNVSLPRDLYRRAETLLPSQRLDYNEDLDLGLRLLRLGAHAAFDDTARGDHQHSKGLRAFARECVSRGEAIADLEARWGERPAQLAPLVEIPSTYSRVLGFAQRRIARVDHGGLIENTCVVIYRAAGLAHLWTVQDGIARVLRRALAMRGYRLRTTDRLAAGSPAGIGVGTTPVTAKGER